MFLPVCKKDLVDRNIEELDFIYVSGDAYVDHPSFGHAIITRLIESLGYTIGIIAQPQTAEDYKKLGTPKHAFLVGSGVVDSMVNNYTVNLRKRSDDVYSEGGIGGKRPDRCLTVYCKNLKKHFQNTPIIIGGIEGSLRRFAHYDYWSNSVMQSILVDTNADLLVYGMGENPFNQIIKMVSRGVPISKIKNISGTSYLVDGTRLPKTEYITLPSYKDVVKSPEDYCKAFTIQSQNTDGRNADVLVQEQLNGMFVVQNKPALPLTEKEMDEIYNLPFERTYHPSYKLGVPAISEVEFSVTSSRGCFGGCSFCAINFHQGRVIQHRSCENIVDEVKKFTFNPRFKGYVHDVGGPSANFYNPSCTIQQKCGVCKNRQCIGDKVCPNLEVSHKDYLNVLHAVRAVPKVKKVFIRSGIRFDYLMMDSNPQFFDELCKYHISGQLKVAPEHISDDVLKFMNKPNSAVYLDFAKRYKIKNEKLGLKQYMVPYFISSHPGCTLKDAIKLAEYLNSIGHMPEQVQDFYPTPSTKSTCAYYTGLNPDTLQKIYVPKTKQEKQMQRALLQWRKNENYDLVKQALMLENRLDLIGYGKNCLIKPLNYAKLYSGKGKGNYESKKTKNGRREKRT